MASRKPEIAWGDDIYKIAAAVAKKIMKGDASSIKQAKRVSGQIRGQMLSQGKKGPAKKFDSSVKSAFNSAKAMADGTKKAAMKESDARVIRQGSRNVNIQQAADGVASKGTIYRGGREVPVSRRDAANLQSRGGAARAQGARGNANSKAKQVGLSKIANDKSLPMAKRRTAREELRRLQSRKNYLD